MQKLNEINFSLRPARTANRLPFVCSTTMRPRKLHDVLVLVVAVDDDDDD